MFSRLEVFSEVCAAVVAQVSLNCKLAVFPCFLGFNELSIAVRALGHSYPLFQLFQVLIKRLAAILALIVFRRARHTILEYDVESAIGNSDQTA